jgi:hypothetical protein
LYIIAALLDLVDLIFGVLLLCLGCKMHLPLFQITRSTAAPPQQQSVTTQRLLDGLFLASTRQKNDLSLFFFLKR